MSGAPHFPARPDPIRKWIHTAPHDIALVDRTTARRWTYRELDERIGRVAGMLRTMGVGFGDRVGALANNRVELIELFFACGRIGAALVPFNWRLSPAELEPVIRHANVKALFVETSMLGIAAQATPDRLYAIDDEYARTSSRSAIAEPVDVDAETPLLILYTSGSTGTPKGAVLPHRQIFYNAIATVLGWKLNHTDIAPITTPCFHTGGWNVFALPLWHAGGRVVLMERFDADDFLHTLQEEQCTVALTVPTQLLLMSESKSWGLEVPSLRSFFSGGAPCPLPLLEKVRAAGYTVREGYGLTECGPNCFTISPEDAVAQPGYVGWPMPFLQMRLVDENGKDVEADEVGELVLRGPQMFGGYLHDEAKTQQALLAGGWLRTGDLARRSRAGAYAICGRRKEMFISGGENVFPGEVEAVLATFPGAIEVAVVGVPDPVWGEVGRAFVVPRGSISESEVIEFAHTRLAKYKTPKSVVFLESLPKLGSGKIDRGALVRWP